MAFVDKKQKIVREIIKKRVRRTARRPAGQHPRIILDTAAEPEISEVFNIIHGAGTYPLSLEQLSLTHEILFTLDHLRFYLFERLLTLRLVRDIVGGGINGAVRKPRRQLTRDYVYL